MHKFSHTSEPTGKQFSDLRAVFLHFPPALKFIMAPAHPISLECAFQCQFAQSVILKYSEKATTKLMHLYSCEEGTEVNSATLGRI